ncbi:MAG TPA: hypothetical protein VJV79_07170 [Polyangiaceae bacterium]|nr:hypothetical protein [Polyangiaceae bacterium]
MHSSFVTRSLALLALLLATPTCVGTTGDQVVDFEAVASGPTDAVTGQPLSFEGSRGWQVTLTNARLHIGAIYLAASMPVSGAQATSCVLPGSYVAQVVQGRDVDLLSNEPQSFPTPGRGMTLQALAGQVWLTSGDVNLANVPAPPTVILRLSGNAQRGSELRPFEAELTIAANRVSSDGGPAGASTICKERIVSPIPTSIRIQSEGALWLRVDPRRLFTNVDFGALESRGGVFVFKDDSSDQPSANLYNNLKQAGSLYDFTWADSLL